MTAGRHSTFTQEMADKICERLVGGESLRAICRDADMPNASTVFVWLSKFPQFAEQYTRAREAQAEAIFDELFDIADDGSNDWMQIETEKGRIKEVVNHEHVTRSRLRFDARRWALARMSPKKYGERITQELTNPDGSLAGLDDAKIAARLEAIQQAAMKRRQGAQVQEGGEDDGFDLV